VTGGRDEEFAEYVSARMPALRRLAPLRCHDWRGADDLQRWRQVSTTTGMIIGRRR
jgi:hypothetical protein